MELSKAAIVVAHPDDEVIWCSSIFAKVQRIVVCYGAVATIPERERQRRDAMAAYPHSCVEFLDFPEPGELSPEEDQFHASTLARHLAELLDGVGVVVTHNAWGEYGHADHRRLNRIVRELGDVRDFDTYVSCYVARHRLAELDRYLAGSAIEDVGTFHTDMATIRPVFDLYRAHGCWTWTPYWEWPNIEYFIKFGNGGRLGKSAFPFLMFDMDSVIGMTTEI